MNKINVLSLILSVLAIIMSVLTIQHLNKTDNERTFVADVEEVVLDNRECTYGLDIYAYRQDARRVLVRLQFERCIDDSRLVFWVKNKIHTTVARFTPTAKDFEMREPLYNVLVSGVRTAGIKVLTVEDVD